MIPDFKTYIGESAWGDMMRRGSGEEIRKEDDINLLDMVGLYEYILSHYELTDNRYELTYGTANMCIPISRKGEEILLTYEFDEVHCYFNLNKYPRLYSLLQKKFNVEEMSDDDEKLSIGEHYIISPKDECTNQFYIDVIDCIIENRNTIVRKKVLNESAWGDMMRRGSGEEIRTEDDINRLDYEEFFVYLTEHYKPKSKKDGIGGRTSIMYTDIIEIFIPIESINGSIKNLMIEMNKNDNHIVSMSTLPTLFDKYVNLERMLSNNYTLNISKLSSRIYLKPKKKPTNRTVVDLIDTFLVVVDNPILEKVS